jgi:hypothetical protein
VSEYDVQAEPGEGDPAPPPFSDRAILVWNGRVARPEPAELEPTEECPQRAFWTLPALRQRVQT